MPVRDPVCHRLPGRRRAGAGGFGCQRPVHAGADLFGHPAEPTISPHRRGRSPLPAERPRPVRGPLAARRCGVDAGAGRGALRHQSGPQFCPDRPLYGLAHCRPAGQPGRLAVPVRVPVRSSEISSTRTSASPHRPAHEALAGVRGGRQLPPGAAAFRLPLRAGRAVPGAAARVPDASRHPARPHPPQRRFLCVCRHPRSGCACCWCWSPAASCLPSRGHCSSRRRHLPSFWRAG